MVDPRSRTSSVDSRPLPAALTLALVACLGLAGHIHAGSLAAVSPAGASAGVSLQITGSGFNPTAANNEVTFRATSGEVATATPTAATLIDASRDLRRLTVRVPAGLPVGRADLTVTNRVSGEESRGLGIDIVGLSLPDVRSAAPGTANLKVRIVGTTNARFAPGSRALFGAGITVHSTLVESSSVVVATITVAANAALGPRTVTVATTTQTVALPDGFFVGSAPPPPNAAPTANAGGPYAGVAGQSVSFAGTAADADNDPLTFTWNFGDQSAAATGAAPSHTYASAGDYTVTLTVDDGRGGVVTASTMAHVSPANRAPEASAGGPYGATVGQTVSFAASASDPDGDPLTYAWDFGDGHAGQGAAPSHQYDAEGTFTVRLTVSDGRGGSTTATATAAITARPNRDPAFTSAPVTQARHQLPYSYQAAATDPDGDALTFSLVGPPAGMTVEPGTGLVEWTPSGPQIGPQAVALKVTDAHGASATQVFDVTVADVTPPVVTLSMPTESLPGRTVTAIAQPSDNLGVVSVRFEVNGAAPTDHAAAPFERGVAVPPTALAGTEFHVRAIATDAAGNTGQTDGIFKVAASPDTAPPVVTLRVAPEATPGSTVLVTASAEDNVGVRSVTFRMGETVLATDLDQPFETSFTVPAGTAVGTSLAFTARATDFSDNVADAAGSLAVVAEPDTTPPTVQITVATTVAEGGRLSFSAVAADNVGVARVEFFVNGVSAGTSTAEPYSGAFQLPLSAAGGDTLFVEARAHDFVGLTASSHGESTVLAAPNRVPAAHAGGPYAGQVGEPIQLTAALSSDPDATDRLAYTWTFGDESAGSGLSPRHAYVTEGTYTARVTVADGRGGVSIAEAVVVVSAATDRHAPSITLTGPTSVLPASQVTVTAQATDDTGVVGVTFKVDGASPTETAAPPYQRVVDVPGVATPGDRITITATARDAAGNEASADAVLTITGAADTESPTVTLHVPPQVGAGAVLRVSATPADNVGVESLSFIVNGTTIATLPAPPYEASYPVPADAIAGSSIGVVVRATDFNGNRGDASAAVAVVRVEDADTTPPTIALTAPLQVFAGRTLPLSAVAQDNVGVAGVRFFVDGVNVATIAQPPFVVDLPLGPSRTAGSLLQVRAVAVDFSNLEGEATAQTLVASAESAGSGVLTGEVYDDTVSLPLAGATVALLGQDHTGAPYTQTATTDARGRWSLRATEGAGVVRITRAGWTRVERAASVVVNRAVEIVDARLTPLPAAGPALSAILGGQVTTPAGPGPPATLSVPPGALQTATSVALTLLSQQGLTGMLPPGWSPVAAVDVAPHGLAFANQATLSLPNAFAIASGTPLVVAGWDEQAAAWRAQALITAPPAGTPFTAGLDRSGQYAVLLADTQPLAPPLLAAGDLVTGVAQSALAIDVTAVVDPQPRVLFYQPGVRSDVQGRLTATNPVSSGALIEARIIESYAFLNDTDVSPEPFVEDVFFYQAGAPAPDLAGRFTVTPSQTFEALALRQGIITVELLAAPPGPRYLNTVDAGGGAVTSPTGERLQVPQGALTSTLPVTVRGLTSGNVGATLPSGLSLAGAALVTFSGPLAKAATLTVPRPPQVTDASRLLLVRAQEIGGETRLLLVGRATIVGTEILSDLTLNGVANAFEGVRVPGRYLFVMAADPVGFANGRVLGAGGGGAPGALVTANTLAVVSLSAASGGYVAAATTGAFELTARDLSTADAGAAGGVLPAPGSVVALDVQIAAAAPSVTSITPIDGAVNVPLASAVVIRFSRAIDPASVNGANAGNVAILGPGGTPVAAAISLSNGNSVITLRPGAALQANTSYRVQVATGVADFVGRHLPAAVIAGFTSLDTAPPAMPAAGSLAAAIPDQAGFSTITATQGSAGVHDTVTVVNVTKGTSQPALVNPDGSFSVRIAAQITDTIQVAITDPSGNQTVVPLGRFRQTNADGSVSAAVTTDGGLLEGPAGTAVEVPAGAFPGGAVVTIRSVPEAQFPVTLDAQAQQVMSFSGAVELDFGGKTPAQYLNVFIPAGPDDKPDDQWVVSLVRQDGARPVLNLVDTAKLFGNRIRTSSPPCPGVTARGVYGIHKMKQSVGLNYGQMYAGGYGGLRVQATMIGLTVPIPYVVLEPVEPAPICYPVLTGRVTVSANSQRVTVPGDQLTPADREIVIKNLTSGREAHFPRNVLEFSFNVAGLASHSYKAVVKDPAGVETQLTAIEVVAGAAAGQVTVRLDADHITTTVASVEITNLTTGTVATFAMANVALTLPIAGGAADTFEVKVYNAGGVGRVIPTGPIVSPTGTGNLVARAVAGAIDPTQAEIDAHNAIPGNPPVGGVGRKDVFLTIRSPQTGMQTQTLIDPALIVGGGFTYAFDGNPTDLYELDVVYDDGRRTGVTIPTFRITVTNRTTGRVIRTITAPSPPRDEPLNLGVISDDIVPPVLTDGPPRMASFDPSGLLTFTFNEPMNAASLKTGLIVELVKGGVRTRVTGTVRVSNGNRTATFVPDTALLVGEEYSITFVGGDALGAALGGGAPPITDRSSNSLATTRFKLTTFKPRVVGTFTDLTAQGGPIEIKDVEVRRKTVGTAQKTYLVGTADARSVSYRVITLDVTAPDAPVKVKTAFGGSGKKRLTLLTDLGTARPAMPVRSVAAPFDAKDCTGAPLTSFTGDLAVTTSYTAQSSYLSFFDVTDVNNPCLLANKLLTATPDTLSDYNRRGTVHALGFAHNVATIQHAQGYAAFAAVGEVGLFAADIGNDIPEWLPEDRKKEGVYAGDYRDIAAFSDRLLAANRADARLEVFDPNLSLLSSIDLHTPPRRIVTTEDYGVDKNDDGVIAADEQFDLAFVAMDDYGTNTFGVAIVDITDLQDMRVIGRIPMPGITRDLAIDPTKRRLFASGQALVPPGSPPGTVAVDALYMIDLSDPFQTGLIDADSDGYDDRVIWHHDMPEFINAVRLDLGRGLLYVGTEKGLQIWAVYDVCCDLGVDMTAQARRRQAGDRESLLAKEKAALQQEITAGLQTAEAQCGLAVATISILEQGSGACLWKANPVQACSGTYQPGLSDHDYEVYFPIGITANVRSCTVEKLSERFINPETDESKEITLPDGSVIQFEDITFFPFNREDFENAKLNVLPPQSAGGDPTGDLGLGRQQLLLLWLLGGEYIHLPGLPALVPGKPLPEILTRLKTTTGIPRLEGFEWAALQSFNLAKSKAFLRIKGASSPASSFHDLYIKQLHDAGKAGVRTAFARLVAFEDGNRIARDVTRSSYESTACLAVNEAVTNPNRWPSKPCTSFEEYAASAVAKSLRGPNPLTIFTLAEVFRVHRFFRVKADVERIISEADADAFIAGVAQFIEASATLTEPIYQQLLPADPDQVQRMANRATADTKHAEALANAKVAVHPHIFNHGFRSAERIQLAMYRSDAAGTGTLVSERRVDLAGGEDQYFSFQRQPDGSLVLVDGKAVPIFSLGPVDLTTDLGVPHGVSFTIDLPEHKMKEAVRTNNVGGFFYYVLNRANPTVPVTPADPYLPLPGSGVLDPSPECDDAPALRITQRIVNSTGQVLQGDAELSLGESITLQLVVTNLSGVVQNDVMVCSNITNQCYSAGALAVGQTKTIDVPHTMPTTGQYFEGTPTTYSTEAGVVAGPPSRLTSSCEPYLIVEPSNNPNPFSDQGRPTSVAMSGGTAFRYYRVINRRTGAPLANATVTMELTGASGGGSVTYSFTFTTNGDGFIHSAAIPPGPGIIPGVPVEATPALLPGLTYFAKFTTVNGLAPTCSLPVEYEVDIQERAFSRTYSRGSSIKGSVGALVGIEGSAEAGLELEREETTLGTKTLNLTQSAEVSTKLGVEFALFKFEGKLGVAKVEAGAEIGASSTRKQGWSSKFAFGYPLDQQKNCAIATLTLQGFAGVNPVLIKLLDLVRTNPCTPLTNYLKSEASTFGRESQAQAGLTLSAKRPMPQSIPTDKHMKVEFGGTAASGFSLSTSYKTSFTNQAGALAATSFAESYSLKGGLNFAAGLTIQPTNPPKTTEEEDDEKTTIETIKRSLKTSVSADLAEGYSVTFIDDYEKQPPPADGYPTSVTVSYSPPKGFGWKLDVAGQPHNLVGGVGRTITYTIEGEEDVKKIVDGLANLDAIRKSNTGAAVLSQIVFAPTVLNDELAKFRDLLRSVHADYEISESTGSGNEFPLGLSGKLGPFKLGFGVAIKSEHAVSYTIEKGRVVKGQSYILERYVRDHYIPNEDLGIFDAASATWEALVGSFAAAHFSDVNATVGGGGGTTQLKSHFTATMNINNALEPVQFEAGLFSWRFREIPGPVQAARYMPSDTAGRQGQPHYGIGGFHQFTPEGYRLAAPTPLVIDYQDAEVAAIDESTLRIYGWNTTTLDWDLVGGVVDAAANTVTATVDTFRLYTLGPAMPARTIALTAVSAGSGGTTERFTVTSAPLVLNTGQAVPDGTLVTVRALSPSAGDLTPYGRLLTADADPVEDEVQVVVQGGVIRFEVEYDTPGGVLIPGRVVAYSVTGTAFGERLVQ